MEKLKPCPICGEPLIIRKSIVGGEEHFVAYCHCGFEFADDCSMEDFVKECNRRAAPENKALTLEQLRQMHGSPVWVVPNRGIAKWYLVDVANEACETCDMDVVDFELYGSENKSYGWLAYARRPEESK